MNDIVVLAFETDMTRVVTFNTGNEGTGPAVPEIASSVTATRSPIPTETGRPSSS